MSKNNLQYFLFSLILLVHVLILTKLIFFPYPELFIYPYLTNHGLKPYQQILDQHFPGLMFLPINFDYLGMNTPQLARVWSITTAMLVQLMLFTLGGQILKNKWKALIVNLLYLAWQPFFEGWVLWIDSFLPLLLLPAFYALLKRRFLLTGLLLGIGIVFKQVLIPLSVFVLFYVFWKEKKFKIILEYLAGLLLPIILMILYFWGIGVIKDFWYWTVVFNLTTYAQFGRGAGPSLAHFIRALLVFGSAFLVIRKIKSKEAQVLLIFLVGGLLGLSTRFDFVHFQPALPFAVIGTIYGLEGLGRLGRLGIFGYVLILVWWQIIFYKGHLGDRVLAFDSETRNIAVKLRNYTNPGEKIFVFGGAPHLYQMSRTLPAGNIFLFQFPWFLKVAQDRILAGIKQDRPNIVVVNKTVKIEGRSITEFGSNINTYLMENYEKIDNEGDTEILRRK